jgi:hypothetical protein
MKKKLALLGSIVALIIAGSMFIGCTDNIRSKAFGGTMTINLAPGQKLVNATWKDAELWYLTRPMRSGETPETFEFHEKSSLGMIEGNVIFQESK